MAIVFGLLGCIASYSAALHFMISNPHNLAFQETLQCKGGLHTMYKVTTTKVKKTKINIIFLQPTYYKQSEDKYVTNLLQTFIEHTISAIQ